MYFGLRAFRNADDTTTLVGPYIDTGKEHSVTVPTRKFNDWYKGELIQCAFPNLSLDDREFLISGMSPEGFENAFNEDD